MQLYETRLTWGAAGSWHGTRADAHAAAKLTPTVDGARVYLWEVPNDKAAVLSILNGGRPAMQLVQAWSLSPRLGLRDMPPDDAMRELEEDEPAAGAPEPPPGREREEPATQGAGESADAFWARVTAENEARKGAPRRKPPTQDELDEL